VPDLSGHVGLRRDRTTQLYELPGLGISLACRHYLEALLSVVRWTHDNCLRLPLCHGQFICSAHLHHCGHHLRRASRKANGGAASATALTTPHHATDSAFGELDVDESTMGAAVAIGEGVGEAEPTVVRSGEERGGGIDVLLTI